MQFQHFVSLCAWLLQQCRRPLPLDKYEDPTSSINKLIVTLRDAGMDIDFPPLKLRSAHGENVVKVLNFLCDLALVAKGFAFGKPVHPEEA
jgi:estrogen-related receptor beta like 1